jgi:hypothetical protein
MSTLQTCDVEVALVFVQTSVRSQS